MNPGPPSAEGPAGPDSSATTPASTPAAAASSLTAIDGVTAALLAAGLLALYLHTLCHGLYWFDSSEMVHCARFLDIPHPPGYPLYLILIRIAGWIPLGPFPARINAVSAVTAALAVPCFYLVARRLDVSAPGALAGALAIALSETYWDLSGVAEVYGLEMLLLALTLLAAIALGQGRGSPLALGLFGGSLVFHRVTNLFCVAGLLWTTRDQIRAWHAPDGRASGTAMQGPRRLALGLGLAALPYALTAYLFFLGGPRGPGMPWSLSWFDYPRNLPTFFRLVTGTLYARHLGLLGPGELSIELAAWLQWGREQIGLVLLALGLLGAVRPPRGMALLLWVLVPNLLFYAHYNAVERDTMYLPGLAALALLGVGALERWPAALRAVALAAIVIAVGAGARTTLSLVDKSSFRGVERADRDVAWWLPRASHLYLTDDQLIYSLLYSRYVDGSRPDLTVTIVDDFTPAIEDGIHSALRAGRAVYSPLFYPPERFERVRSRFTAVPEGFLYRLVASPESLPPVHGIPRQIGGTARLWGADLRGEDPAFSEGTMVVLRATWAGLPQEPAPAAPATREPIAPATVALDLQAAPDVPVLLLAWSERAIALAVGSQGRPAHLDAALGQSVMTEELMARIPDGVRGRPLLFALPSRRDAIRQGILDVSITSPRPGGSFFKGLAEDFVQCVEEGVPAYAYRLVVRGDWRRAAVGPIDAGGAP